MSPCFRWFLSTPSSFCRSLWRGFSFDLALCSHANATSKPLSMQFLKISTFQTNLQCPTCPWPWWEVDYSLARASSSHRPAATSKHALPHFLHYCSSILGRALYKHQQIHFFIFFKVFFSPQVPIKIGTNSTAALLRALPCLCLEVPHYAPSSRVLPLSS